MATETLNYPQTTQFAHSAATTGKQFYLVGGKVFMAIGSEDANATNGWVYAGKIRAPKAAVALSPGDALYWDDTNKVMTNVTTGNTLCGHAVEAAASGDAEVVMHFNAFA